MTRTSTIEKRIAIGVNNGSVIIASHLVTEKLPKMENPGKAREWQAIGPDTEERKAREWHLGIAWTVRVFSGWTSVTEANSTQAKLSSMFLLCARI
jgi:hypothetical protein